MPTFDIVSEVKKHELANMVDQVQREIENRFDFRGTKCGITLDNLTVTLTGDAEFHLQQLKEIVINKCAKRDIDPKSLDFQNIESNLHMSKQTIVIKDGIDAELGKKIGKILKESKIKVQSSIQENQVRVTGKKRDDLQAAMQLLKETELPLPLQFQNFRD
mgnify:CR=1 FL=1